MCFAPQHGAPSSRKHPGLHWLGHDVSQLLHTAMARDPLPPIRLTVRLPQPHHPHAPSDDEALSLSGQRACPPAYRDLRNSGVHRTNLHTAVDR